MDIKRFPSATTPESVKAIKTVKAMQFLHSQNVTYAGMNEDQILNTAALIAAFQKDQVVADASITDPSDFIKDFTFNEPLLKR